MSEICTIIKSTLCEILGTSWCNLTHLFQPKPPQKPDYSSIYTSPEYSVKSYGECNKGSYIEVYQPGNPYLGENGKPKVVIYLHGFDLGASQIYGSHLIHLVKQGYYVFYPNYQTGFCSFPSKLWQTVAELAEEVIGDGLIDSQEKWLNNALQSVTSAYGTVGFTSDTELDTYLYGHSLGGLFALSWAYYVQQESYPSNMLPLQVVVADPIPNTAISGVPGQLGQLLEKITDDVDIEVTGSALTMPVAILHGNNDWVAPKDEWQEPFTYIATEQKKMFLSYTDQHGCPGMYANHEQATVDTSFFPPFLALTVLDGIGVENDLDWRYIWHGLDQVIRFGVRADQLEFDMGSWSDGTPVKEITVFLPSSDTQC
jgi:pimeloyl-ACP methyl ester carboxylesterase